MAVSPVCGADIELGFRQRGDRVGFQDVLSLEAVVCLRWKKKCEPEDER